MTVSVIVLSLVIKGYLDFIHQKMFFLNSKMFSYTITFAPSLENIMSEEYSIFIPVIIKFCR